MSYSSIQRPQRRRSSNLSALWTNSFPGFFYAKNQSNEAKWHPDKSQARVSYEGVSSMSPIDWQRAVRYEPNPKRTLIKFKLKRLAFRNQPTAINMAIILFSSFTLLFHCLVCLSCRLDFICQMTRKTVWLLFQHLFSLHRPFLSSTDRRELSPFVQ